LAFEDDVPKIEHLPVEDAGFVIKLGVTCIALVSQHTLRIESARSGETMQDHDQENLYPVQVAAFRRFNEWEEQRPFKLDPGQTLAATGAAHDLIPPEARQRDMDTEGVRKMHAAFPCLSGRAGIGSIAALGLPHRGAPP
jgi:hypothetical protein